MGHDARTWNLERWNLRIEYHNVLKNRPNTKHIFLTVHAISGAPE